MESNTSHKSFYTSQNARCAKSLHHFCCLHSLLHFARSLQFLLSTSNTSQSPPSTAKLHFAKFEIGTCSIRARIHMMKAHQKINALFIGD